MNGATRFRTDSPYEAAFGYSRAVRRGNAIAVAGTTATRADGSMSGGDDPAAQARHIFGIVEGALRELGGTLEDVVRVRFYLRDIRHVAAVLPVYREVLGEVAPAVTAVEVSRFVSDDILVEIEVDAALS